MGHEHISHQLPSEPQAALWKILLQWSMSLSVGATSLHGLGVSHRDQSGPPAWAQRPLPTGVGCGECWWCWRGVVRWGWVVVLEIWIHLHLSTHTCTQSLNGKCSPPTTYGVPSLKHKLDMETTCICIHVTAGSMAPSQPKP